LLPWLANPGNPAMSPHAEGDKTGTCDADKTVERKGETGEGRGDSLQGVPTLRKNASAQKNAT